MQEQQQQWHEYVILRWTEYSTATQAHQMNSGGPGSSSSVMEEAVPQSGGATLSALQPPA